MDGGKHGVRRALLVVAVAYAVLGALALFAIPASAFGWLGVEPDPLSGIFALLLALPWTIGLYLLGDIGTWGSLAFCTVAILASLLILLRLSRKRKISS